MYPYKDLILCNEEELFIFDDIFKDRGFSIRYMYNHREYRLKDYGLLTDAYIYCGETRHLRGMRVRRIYITNSIFKIMTKDDLYNLFTILSSVLFEVGIYIIEKNGEIREINSKDVKIIK